MDGDPGLVGRPLPCLWLPSAISSGILMLPFQAGLRLSRGMGSSGRRGQSKASHALHDKCTGGGRVEGAHPEIRFVRLACLENKTSRTKLTEQS